MAARCGVVSWQRAGLGQLRCSVRREAVNPRRRSAMFTLSSSSSPVGLCTCVRESDGAAGNRTDDADSQVSAENVAQTNVPKSRKWHQQAAPVINIWTHFCPETKHRFEMWQLQLRNQTWDHQQLRLSVFRASQVSSSRWRWWSTETPANSETIQTQLPAGQRSACCAVVRSQLVLFYHTRVLLLHWRVYVLLHHVSCDPRRVWLSSSSAESSRIGSSHSRDHSSSSCVIIWSQTWCADVCRRSELQIWDLVKTDKMKICYQIWIQHLNHHKHLTDSSFMFQHGNNPNTPPAQGSTPGQKHTGELSEPQHHWSFILTANTPASFRKPGELFPRILTELTLSSRLKVLTANIQTLFLTKYTWMSE